MKHIAIALLALALFSAQAATITEVGTVDGATIGYERLSWKTDSAVLMAQPWWGNQSLAAHFATGLSAFQDYSGPAPFYGPFFAYAEGVDPANPVYGFVYFENWDPFVSAPIFGVDIFSLNGGGDPAVGNGAVSFAVSLPDVGSTAGSLAMGCAGLFLVGFRDGGKEDRPENRPLSMRYREKHNENRTQ